MIMTIFTEPSESTIPIILKNKPYVSFTEILDPKFSILSLLDLTNHPSHLQLSMVHTYTHTHTHINTHTYLSKNEWPL